MEMQLRSRHLSAEEIRIADELTAEETLDRHMCMPKTSTGVKGLSQMQDNSETGGLRQHSGDSVGQFRRAMTAPASALFVTKRCHLE